jgi:small conductance mechanosensitive channel
MSASDRNRARDGRNTSKLFSTRSYAWREAGLARQLSVRAVKRARIQAIVLMPLLVGILIVYGYRDELFGHGYQTLVQAVTAVVLIALGWQIARDVGRSIGPTLFRRLDPGTAGTVGFLIRLLFVGIAVVVALRIAGLDPRTLAVGGAFTAVIVGLAAQQTLGNLIAGTVLLSARPFRVGERVRLQGGGIAGQIEGIVSSLGLLYTTFARGDDQVMVPNSVVLNVAIVPLREPDSVDLRARLSADVTPLEVQELLDRTVETPVRDRPHITLEEIDGDEVVVRISATPERPSDGPRLASEVLEAMASQTTRPEPPPHAERTSPGRREPDDAPLTGAARGADDPRRAP